MNKLLHCKLIGIGEFSHGIQESWEFRFNLLKYAMKNSNKNIIYAGIFV
jgi:erythromycin esterase-like protein